LPKLTLSGSLFLRANTLSFYRNNDRTQQGQFVPAQG
jgi:hypothetical protein